ncbi:MAG: hypothetical protein A2231_11305 [Candidatus Firestonebacteria bacterium RIFOXYA2_FULL_40_8]|nr:MAG: hypothetical protein A2231_11305 [Candidatus Firestonebacteria bacterium RIFOXYA2_FULL_40_8]
MKKLDTRGARGGCMRKNVLVVMAVLMAWFSNTGFAAGQTAPVIPKKMEAGAQIKLGAAYANLPLCFEANKGQTDAAVKFLARGKGYTLFLTSKEAVLALKKAAVSKEPGEVVRMSLNGSNADPKVQGLDILPGQSSYMTGSDSKKWQTSVEQYSKVEYKEVYPGIDMVYYGNQGQLEYDFVVAPGANPGLIRMDFRGARNLELDKEGNLILALSEGKLTFNAPVLYQKSGSTKEVVAGRFVLAGKEQVSFEVASYDKSKELIIDPTVLYSTYLGGTVEDRINAVVLDGSDNVYLAGLTVSTGFPGSGSGFQTAISAGTDAFVTKISSGGALLWSTYLGGNGIDIANAIAVDNAGVVYVTGSTTSATFPMQNANQGTYIGSTDTFVTAVSASGAGLVYSTYLGGSGVDEGNGIAVNTSTGAAYVIGVTTPAAPTAFPTNLNPDGIVTRGASDVFVTNFSPAGGLVYSIFLGGTTADIGRAIALDGTGKVYVTGQTTATFPTTSGAFKEGVTGATDAFVSKISADFASLLYSTYVGGNGNEDATGIALDGSLNVYITGYTDSTANFPTTGFTMVGQTIKGTGEDAFVFKLSMGSAAINDGVYATFFGGDGIDRASAIKVDAAGDAYITGYTTSTLTGFPLNNPIYGTRTGASMAFVAEIGPAPVAAELPVFCTYLGGTDGATNTQGLGVGLDSANNIYAVGWTTSALFPTAGTAPMPVQSANGGASGTYDGFLTKISAPSPAQVVTPVITPAAGTYTGSVTITMNTGTSGATIRYTTNGTAPDGSSTLYTAAFTQATTVTLKAIALKGGMTDSTTVTSAFTILPLLTGVNPAGGSTAGGTTVTITGSAFTGTTAVTFDVTGAVSFTVNSNTQITAVAPAHSAGLVDIFVTTPAGTSSAVSGDTYTFFVPGTAPVVTLLAPASGSNLGGSTITITGSGFTGVTGANGVKFGATNAASYIVVSDTKITAVTPVHISGNADVVITNAYGASLVVSAGIFTFAVPAVTFTPYIFPSPTSGNTATVAYFMDSPGIMKIRVYSEVGKLMEALEESKSASTQSSVLNVGNLAPGVYFYFLNIRYDDGTTKNYPKHKFAVTH